jgi:hypothetical protein
MRSAAIIEFRNRDVADVLTAIAPIHSHMELCKGYAGIKIENRKLPLPRVVPSDSLGLISLGKLLNHPSYFGTLPRNEGSLKTKGKSYEFGKCEN